VTVVLHGTGRLPVALAGLLAAANIGRVSLHDSGEVHRHDSAPGGLVAADEGRRFNEAAHDALRRAAPDVDTRSLGPSDRADLVVLTGEAPVTEELRSWLHRRGTAHLVVRTGADEAVVGPLVLPGLTSCLACADLTRLERDPAWSLLAVQLCTPRRYADPSDLALTNLTASLAALQALAYLDGDEPSVLSSSLELAPPDWRVRRRAWAPHPHCDCEASGIGGPG
jgi:bacteriocin biosynthesis cyclodehydratase domain-containing protein